MKILLFILTLFFSVIAFADDTNSIDLSPPSTDLSAQYLYMLFGEMEGVLPLQMGSSVAQQNYMVTGISNLLGTVFSVFNGILVVFITFILGYTTIVSVLNTAHEGEFLGKKWSSIWVPLRMILGLGILVPKASGYCMIQIFFMWLIIQGVGTADKLWNTILTQLNQGNTLVQIPMGISIQQNTYMLGLYENVSGVATSVFSSLVCMYVMQDLLAQNNPGISSDNLLNTILPISLTATSVSFPASTIGTANASVEPGFCGSLTWDTSSSNTAFNQAKAVAVGQLISDLNSSAQQAVQFCSQNSDCNTSQGQSCFNNMCAPIIFAPDILLMAVNSYANILQPVLQQALQQSTNPGGAIQAAMQQLTQGGWVLAGMTYMNLASANTQTVLGQGASDLDPGLHYNANNNYKQTAAQVLPSQSALITLESFMTYAPNAANNALNTLKAQGTLNPGFSNWSEQFSEDMGSGGNLQDILNGMGNNNPNLSSSEQNAASAVGALGGPLAQYGFNILVNIAASPNNPLVALDNAPLIGDLFKKLLFVNIDNQIIQTLTQNNVNPIVAASNMGILVLTQLADIWLWGTVILAGTSAFASLVQLGSMVTAVLMWFVPFFSIVFGAALFSGVTLAFYVPMIPFMIFLFGVIGWFVLVIEAIALAPIAAIGLSFPDGQHEVLGRAEPALALMISLFLRPSLMLIGFILGTGLSYIAISLLNGGFLYILSNTVATANFQSSVATMLIFPLLILPMYAAFSINIVNKAYILIIYIADQVARWLGAQPEHVAAGVEQVAQGIKSELGSATGAIAQGVGSSQHSAIQAGTQPGSLVGKGLGAAYGAAKSKYFTKEKKAKADAGNAGN